MSQMPKVVIGILGPTLDAGQNVNRWMRWRPTVALCQQDDLEIDRLELLYSRRFQKLAETVVEDIRQVSPKTQVRLHELTLRDPWALDEVYEALLDFAQRYAFKPEKEDYFVHITTGTHIAQICFFLLTESRHLPARLIQTSPYRKTELRKADTAGTYSLIDLDLSKYDRLAQRFEKELRSDLSFLKSGIETKNEAFNRLIENIEHVGVHSRDPILLMGPTGSGKSQLAKRLFELKKLRHQLKGEFTAVNCATLRGDGAMSTLFGHVKGAFTGAQSERPGMLRRAHEGVLFLDEIGELGLDEQTMLLKALEEKTFLPVGSDREVMSDFQLLAGTNRDLVAEMKKGHFREDLLARINLWTFRLPSLRERPEDIEPNLDYELEQSSRKLNRVLSMTSQARGVFLEFAKSPEATWPGNFRDFNASLRRMATLAVGGRIGLQEVNDEIARLQEHHQRMDSPSMESPPVPSKLKGIYWDVLDEFDRVQLEHVLKICAEADSLSEAGRRLFAVSRKDKKDPNDADRLRKYLARFGVNWNAIKAT